MAMENKLKYQFKEADLALQDFVFGFSYISNLHDLPEGTIIPNGLIDLVWCQTIHNERHVLLMGLETTAKPMPQGQIQAFFSISFNPLALEYILHESIADLLNIGKELPPDFWDFKDQDLNDFDTFCNKANQKIKSLIPENIDNRKRQLFRHIFQVDGNINIKDLATKIGWTERQINRYFNQKLGLSLKTYCTILRFQAALPYIKKGLLAPQFDNFTDQSHFIKDIKKMSGVSPKELFKNKNDRFLQFLIYPST